MSQPVIAITTGDVSGIGPEIVVRSIAAEQVRLACLPLVIGDPQILASAARMHGLTLRPQLREVTSAQVQAGQLPSLLQQAAGQAAGPVLCWNPAGTDARQAPPGIACAAAGDAAFQYLTAAIRLAQAGTVQGIATAPLNKAALHLAGHQFPGHTEILADRCQVSHYAMMLHLPESRIQPVRALLNPPPAAAAPLRHGLSIAHVTLHTSVASVPQLLSTESIVEKIRLMRDFLAGIGCQRGAIGVCALNPHGGENGLFGDEESRIIEPAVQQCAETDIAVSGPHPVDTLVRRAFAGEFDGLVAMYHDQGHIPIKLIGFDSAVNITLGLPIVRTSPTHGTAFDRAWHPQTPADPSGMIEAILTAVQLVS